jgi:hypothetical protein
MAVASSVATAKNSTSSLNDVEPGVLGFLVVAALGVALFFLLRSMNKHLRKIGPKPVAAIDLEDLEAVPDDMEADDMPAGAVPGEVLHRQDATDARRD